jgi:hypothetical protein
MIGVAATLADQSVIEEFFELFKTPWERVVPTKRYQVALTTDVGLENVDAELVLVFSSKAMPADADAGVAVESATGAIDVEWAGASMPIYGRVALFGPCNNASVLRSAGRTLDYRCESGRRVVHRIGYDLFREIETLLTIGQPAPYAPTPTLELHIALLRQLLVKSGVSFVEVLPQPAGYDFTCCLTHDVDFLGIRRHKLDRTLSGFAFRASVGTLVDLIRGRRRLTDAFRNWRALLSLPLVFAGLLPDFWQPFNDYARGDRGRKSTFFLLPFKGRPGRAHEGAIDVHRAAPYDVNEVRREVTDSAARGNEIALHGIDAWCDAEAGGQERARLSSATGETSRGVRMHWLYFGKDSPRQLEAGGFEYDSTCGYNDAVGYKAGTSQVFHLPGTRQLMELPMSIMDSALFYPGRMGLAPVEALRRCRLLVANAKRFGGTVVVNWHDRSLAPERLWGRFYGDLLSEIESGNQVWFATASQAVDWFRWRRSIRFTEERNSTSVTVAASAPPSGVPAAILRSYRCLGAADASTNDHRVDGLVAVRLAS